MKFNKKLLILFVILLSFLVLILCSLASTSTPIEAPYAIIVGANNYIDPMIPKLYFCIADAQDIMNTLLNSTMWSSENIVYLPNATKTDIENAIEHVKVKIEPDGLILFYFSGHGNLSPDGSRAYICPADSSYTSFANDIEDDELERWLDGIPTNRKCVILDTCFSGAFIKKPPPDLIIKTYLKMDQKITTALTGTGFFVKLSKAGYVLLTASDDNEASWEHRDLKNGVFTYYLDEGFNSPYEVDINTNQEISAEENYLYSNPKVTEFVRNFMNNEQHPQIYDGYPGELTLKTY
ncbi:MAG: caspase family protein [Candidatus Lokiarchaeota archaeon]|nr:caspase family protein [Candidatus Lokiarchaeota archaeon]